MSGELIGRRPAVLTPDGVGAVTSYEPEGAWVLIPGGKPQLYSFAMLEGKRHVEAVSPRRCGGRHRRRTRWGYLRSRMWAAFVHGHYSDRIEQIAKQVEGMTPAKR